MKRVVVTGMGVIAANGTGLEKFNNAIKNGLSGIRVNPWARDWEQGCQVAGIPEVSDDFLSGYLPEYTIKAMKSTSVKFACITAIEAWLDAGLIIDKVSTDWDTGCIIGTSSSDFIQSREMLAKINSNQFRKLGTRFTEQLMFSGVSAYVGGVFGLGNWVFSNCAACSTGTEAIILAYERIKYGGAKRMIAGGSEAISPQGWASFDAMGVLSRKSNMAPELASRPMNASVAGFIPSAGSAVLILEEFESAQKRGARIYAEILSGTVTCGGQRCGGSMTAVNREGVRRCISAALSDAAIKPEEIDLICGHLTSTIGDKIEISNWAESLGRKGKDFPYINSLKSMIGHCLSAAGAIESVAAILQLYNQFIHPNLNCDDLHPDITAIIDPSRIPVKSIANTNLRTVIKANFGFGDVNSCIILSKV